MSNVYIMRRPAQALQTVKFRSYDAAIEFSSKSGLLKPTKPYKRLMLVNGAMEPIWCVTLAHSFKQQKATYEKIAA